MKFNPSTEFPEVHYVDDRQLEYQSNLLLILCSDETYDLGYLIGTAGGSYRFINRTYHDLKCLGWVEVTND